MKHICFYTTIETFNHKKSGRVMYWELKNFPKLYREYDRLFDGGKDDEEVFDGEQPRLYFAYDGMIRGYFVVLDWEDKGWFYVEFDAGTWTDIKPIPTKPHQGFKYIEEK